MKNRIILLFLSLLFISGCERIDYSIDNPIAGMPTKVIMHRGCGSNPNIRQNTVAAAEYGLSILDGIELDVQISTDGTLWLEHSNEVHDCDGNKIGCFQTLSDAEINEVAVCNGEVQYEKLEEVFQLMTTKYPNSIISLDIKGQYCQITKREIMRKMAQSVIDLVLKYNMVYRVLVESSSEEFMQEFENQNCIGQCAIMLSGDVDEALAFAKATNARGISIKYGVETIDADVVKMIHNKGYGVMLWSIDDPADIVATWNAKPDCIQTDNPDFKKYIPVNE